MAPKSGAVWEDREVLFDLPFSYLRLRSGEKIFDRIDSIEDTKGNSGMKAVGLNCIISTTTKIVNSGLRGTTQALYVLAAFKSNRYEFIFTNLSPRCVRHYTSVVGIHKSYANSRLYRDLKLRGAIVHNKHLRLLPLEKIILIEHSIWNLSSDAGNLGNMVVTNVRIVWFADGNQAFNVSMPYITIESISIRDSKFGEALVIVVRPNSGGYILGFRAEPTDRLRPFFTELTALHQAYNEKPIFGVEFNWNDQHLKQPEVDNLDDLVELGEPRGEMGPQLYMAAKGAAEGRTEGVEYNPYLGLAIQPLQSGITLKTLFEVQTSS